MNSLAWIAQIILAACFLVTGVGKLFAYKRLLGVVEARFKGRPAGVSLGWPHSSAWPRLPERWL